MNRIILILTIFILGYHTTYATEQIPDNLIYNRKKFSLGCFYPNCLYLELFFEKHPEKKPKIEHWTTALWRRYIATFEIENEQLFLTKIEVMEYDENKTQYWKNILSEVFPNSEKVKCDWFTGVFVGGNDYKVHWATYDYSSFCVLEIQDGNVISDQILKRKQYKKLRKRQAKIFKKTEEYKELIRKEKKERTESLEEYKKVMGEERTLGMHPPSEEWIKEMIDLNVFFFIPKLLSEK